MGEYTPTDITPPELRPTALARHVPDWAEAAPTPDDVHDWPQRQAAALIPFELDERGWPQHPLGRTGRTGRNLPRWGENQAADPIVVAGTGPDRRVLLITRSDNGGEAVPGGMADPGEPAPTTLLRELREETGVDLSDHRPIILGQHVVDDWRQSDNAWVVSTSALYLLPATVPAIGSDDALEATWWPFADLDQLDAAITAAGRTLYTAHRTLLQRALDHLAEPTPVTTTQNPAPVPAADRTEQNLTEALAHVIGDVARTDSKAGLLLGLDGVLAAAVAILAQAKGAQPLAIAPVVAILLAATVLAVLVVRPRIAPHDRSSYAHWATCTRPQLRAELVPDRRLDRLSVLSALCHRKMLLLRWSADITILALAALAAAALLTAA
ncbi:NUDIX domain-containing protein [Kitasatospora sp. NPDC051984]|uniref:NUDIX domain-containing protein n=1 Tax=Kitasatospora sp. NPDC051984 TaxID=3364059 RepID=UPI0037C9DFE8